MLIQTQKDTYSSSTKALASTKPRECTCRKQSISKFSLVDAEQEKDPQDGYGRKGRERLEARSLLDPHHISARECLIKKKRWAKTDNKNNKLEFSSLHSST